MQAAHEEIATFSYIMLLDHDEDRVKEAEMIRKMDSFKTMNDEDGEPSQDRFVELCNLEAVAKGTFARRISRDLHEPV